MNTERSSFELCKREEIAKRDVKAAGNNKQFERQAVLSAGAV